MILDTKQPYLNSSDRCTICLANKLYVNSLDHVLNLHPRPKLRLKLLPVAQLPSSNLHPNLLLSNKAPRRRNSHTHHILRTSILLLNGVAVDRVSLLCHTALHHLAGIPHKDFLLDLCHPMDSPLDLQDLMDSLDRLANTFNNPRLFNNSSNSSRPQNHPQLDLVHRSSHRLLAYHLLLYQLRSLLKSQFSLRI